MTSRCKINPAELPPEVLGDWRRSAEVRMYNALKEQLPWGWSVYYSVRWLAPIRGGEMRDGEADFIIAHPERGILVVEVKGGAVHRDGKMQKWWTVDRYGQSHRIKDPFEQAVCNKHGLIRKLKDQPTLRNRRIRFFHAVAFPDVVIASRACGLGAPQEIIIGAEHMDRLLSKIEEVFEHYEEFADGAWSDGKLVLAELDRLVAQDVEFRNPLSLQLNEEEREIIRLTEQQLLVLNGLRRNRRAAIAGCAGSGKTMLAIEKAKRLAGEGFRTLLTCFNKPLAQHLAGAVAGVENLWVANFHTVCSSAARNLSWDLPAEKTRLVLEEGYPRILQAAMQATPDEDKYDAIVVDEGQDFPALWWEALEHCMIPQGKAVLYIFYDNNQALYRKYSELPGVDVHYELPANIRNTRKIFDFLKKHYRGESCPVAFGPPGRAVETYRYSSLEELERRLGSVLHKLLIKEGCSPRDIVVLTPKNIERSALMSLKLPGSIRLVPRDNREQVGDVLCSSVHRFKGLERKVAVVTELDDDLLALRQEERESLYYVAFSRPRNHLVLLSSPAVLTELLHAAA
ncbi:MAG TPA: NERD domain-containing protein [Candidatus Obscuribacterales bacterium]